MMPYTELAHGVWYPKDGMYQVVEALMAIARQAGVEFVFWAGVKRIEVKEGWARSVVLADDHRVEADAIVANCDILSPGMIRL